MTEVLSYVCHRCGKKFADNVKGIHPIKGDTVAVLCRRCEDRRATARCPVCGVGICDGYDCRHQGSKQCSDCWRGPSVHTPERIIDLRAQKMVLLAALQQIAYLDVQAYDLGLTLEAVRIARTAIARIEGRE